MLSRAVELHLFATQDAARTVVGRVPAGTPVRLGPPRPDGSRAFAFADDRTRVEDARLTVSAG